jgi:hypothetical protein
MKNKTNHWSAVKAKLAGCDPIELIELVQDLYNLNKENQIFLNGRLEMGGDALHHYKTVISQSINPKGIHLKISVAQAKKAISDYKKAVGHQEGIAELSVFYCEEVFNFLSQCGVENENFYDALVRIFEQALKYIALSSNDKKSELISRLDRVRVLGDNLGWGVGEDFDNLWEEAGLGEI